MSDTGIGLTLQDSHLLPSQQSIESTVEVINAHDTTEINTNPNLTVTGSHQYCRDSNRCESRLVPMASLSHFLAPYLDHSEVLFEMKNAHGLEMLLLALILY